MRYNPPIMKFTTPFSARFWLAIQAVSNAIGAHMQRYNLTGGMLYALGLRLWRLRLRFDVVSARWHAGTLQHPAKQAPRAKKTTPKAKDSDSVRFPNGKGWLRKMIPGCMQGAGEIENLLHLYNTREMVEAFPHTGRSLRVICHMLGVVQPDWLKLPPRPRKPRPPKPRKPRARKRPIHYTRKQIDKMTAAELTARYGKLPPHFPLPIPNLNYIRRKIAQG